jgi:HD-GYP domain-containing protein (c-di-GMP phosphodiesterase class II)
MSFQERLTDSKFEESQLLTLLRLFSLFNSSLDLDKVLEMVMDEVITILKAERGFIMLLDTKNCELVLSIARNMDHQTIQEDEFTVSKNIILKSATEKAPIISFNAMEDPRFDQFQSVSVHNLRSILCVPMLFKGDLTGLIYVDNRIKSGVFREPDKNLLQTIADVAAIALENARSYLKVKNTIKVLANSIEAKDDYTRGHVERVSHYCVEIGRELGLNERSLEELEIAGILHDIGKIGIPDTILKKQNTLTPEERETMKMHPDVGEDIVSPIEFSQDILKAIKHHQEHYDGQGYPGGLCGDDIPLYARIVAVADTYDAMTSDRPYRKSKEEAAALAELKRASGTQLDPRVVEAFLHVLKAPRLS